LPGECSQLCPNAVHFAGGADFSALGGQPERLNPIKKSAARMPRDYQSVVSRMVESMIREDYRERGKSADNLD
jgi:hypothetical protein